MFEKNKFARHSLLMKKYSILLLVLLGTLISGSSSAATEKYRLILRDDPATTMCIGWNQVSGENAVVYFDTQAHGTDYKAYAQQQEVDVSNGYKAMNNRFVRLTGLKPMTTYYFVIRDEEGCSNQFFFTTLSDQPDQRLAFIAGGDSRTFREPRQKGNQMVAKLRPHGVIFAGDMINHGTDEEWQNWLDDWQHTIANDGRMTPIIPARGNHEKKNAHIYKLFDCPSKRVYYSLTFGGNLMQLITLNTEIVKGGRQTMFLKKTLKAHQDVTWRVTQYHKPARPHIARKAEGKGQYKKWIPQFQKYGVKLAIECDSHTHKVTWPIVASEEDGNEEGFVRNDQEGIVYVGEGCWGAPLQTNDDDKSWTRDSGRINQVKWVFVDQEKIEIRTVMYDNVKEVQSVPADNPFAMPAGIRLRKMSDGADVVTILNS